MFVEGIGLLVVAVLAELGLSSGQVCSPISIPPLGGDTPFQSVGEWFAYRQTGEVTTNQRIHLESFGATVRQNVNATVPNAIQEYMQIVWLSQGTCQHEFWVGLYNVDGTQLGNDAVSTDNYSVTRFRDYSILYHDYGKLLLGYGCGIPNRDGTCTNPLIWAQTRTRPDQLSTSDMDNFDSIINNALKKSCLSVLDMPKQIYDDKLQTCPLLDQPPPCIAGLIRGTQGVTPPSDQAGSGPPPTCKWPLKINVSMDVKSDPLKMEGLWYLYRTRFQGVSGSVNSVMRFIWTNINKGMIASANITGMYMWQEFAVVPPGSTECANFYWSGLVADAAGSVNMGIRVINNGTAEEIVPDNTYTLFQDDNYQFIYVCYFPNLATGLCEVAYGYMAFRNNPADVPQSEKDRVDNEIITPMFKQYGCTANDMQLILHPRDVVPCPFKGASPCLNTYIAGYKEQAVQSTPAYG